MSKGFTLIELLIVVSIIGMMSVLGVASYNQMNDRYKAEQGARAIVSGIRKFQKNIDSGTKCNATANLTTITITKSGNSLFATSNCGGANLEEFFPKPSLPSTVTVGDFNPFNILPLSQGFDSDRTIDVTSGSYTYLVNISKAGATYVSKQ